MILIDTNILLYSANLNSEKHNLATSAMERCVNGTENWTLTWGIFYEFLRVSTHPRVFPQPLSFDEAVAFLMDLLEYPTAQVITETSLHMSIVGTCAKEVHRLSGNLLHDFHTAVLMKEHGITDILTFDQDFKAFPWVKILQPVS